LKGSGADLLDLHIHLMNMKASGPELILKSFMDMATVMAIVMADNSKIVSSINIQ
jgi:hypothetical protein